MPYTLHFSAIANYRDYILGGIWMTVHLSVLSIILGCMLGIILASLCSMGNRAVRVLIEIYVEINM